MLHMFNRFHMFFFLFLKTDFIVNAVDISSTVSGCFMLPAVLITNAGFVFQGIYEVSCKNPQLSNSVLDLLFSQVIVTIIINL